MTRKRRMQEIRFRSVDELLEFLPEDQLVITQRLREIVTSMIPGVTERLAYQVPYYRRYANICFIWPGAVPWGNTTQEGVRFGFTRGHLLNDELGYLDRGSRKQVYWRDFHTTRDIDDDILSAYLVSAVEIDAQIYARKRKNT